MHCWGILKAGCALHLHQLAVGAGDVNRESQLRTVVWLFLKWTLPFPAFFLSKNTYLLLLELNKALIKKEHSTIADYLLSNKSQWCTVLLSLHPSPPFFLFTVLEIMRLWKSVVLKAVLKWADCNGIVSESQWWILKRCSSINLAA